MLRPPRLARETPPKGHSQAASMTACEFVTTETLFIKSSSSLSGRQSAVRATQPEAAPRGEQRVAHDFGPMRLTATAWPSSTPPMDPPEETRELPDVTIRAQETSPGFFVASYHPTSPETHPARQGFSIDTKRGLRGKNLAKVLDFAEAYWRQNYPDT